MTTDIDISILSKFALSSRHLSLSSLENEYNNVINHYQTDLGNLIDLIYNYNESASVSLSNIALVDEVATFDDGKQLIITSLFYVANELATASLSFIQSDKLVTIVDRYISSSINANTKHMISILEIFIKALTHVNRYNANTTTDIIVVDDAIISIAIHQAIAHIDNKNLQVSEIGCKLSNLILDNPLYTKKYLTILMDASKKHNTFDASQIYVRYASIMSRVISSGDAQFSASLACGAVDACTSLAYSNDILIQMIALDELLIWFANTTSGFQYLFSSGMIEWIVTTAYGNDTDSPNMMLSSQALRLLGGIFKLASKSTINNDYITNNSLLIKQFLHAAVIHVEVTDDINRLAGIGALADFACSSLKAFSIVIADEQLVDAWISLLNAKVEIQSFVLHSIATVLNTTHQLLHQQQQQQQGNEDLAGIKSAMKSEKMSLLSAISKAKHVDYIVYLMKSAKQPMSDLRSGAYDVIRCIACESWGAEILIRSSGFEEFIFNRDTEFSKEGKDLKFAIIEGLHRNDAFLPQKWRDSIHAFIQQGPYYTSPISSDILLMDR